MGQVIALKPSQASERPTPTSGGAEILFFTGVRYHRMTDEEFALACAPKPRRVAKTRAAQTGMTKTGAAKGKRCVVSRPLERHA